MREKEKGRKRGKRLEREEIKRDEKDREREIGKKKR